MASAWWCYWLYQAVVLIVAGLHLHAADHHESWTHTTMSCTLFTSQKQMFVQGLWYSLDLRLRCCLHKANALVNATSRVLRKHQEQL